MFIYIWPGPKFDSSSRSLYYSKEVQLGLRAVSYAVLDIVSKAQNFQEFVSVVKSKAQCVAISP